MVTRIDAWTDDYWGYVLEKWDGTHPLFPGLRVVRQHRRIIAEELGRALSDDEVVHHIDGNRANNERSNLQLMTDREHRILHSTGRIWSEESKRKASVSALARLTDEERKIRSERAARQHAEGNFGRTTWTRPANFKKKDPPLTREQVQYIRDRRKRGWVSQTVFMKEFGVSQTVISKAMRGLYYQEKGE